ncbi:MarR family transcriptional regulator [Clostridium sp. SM-530-WT-3G]|uniref:MarR family winged helix-turn-helix transcriptional regulator n=1 Tax=Clostridium sp. SM-530-WT-3G TaxID=2725303 RepID=UPI00145D7061|nr:MarR family transcriptional regulator [Clostridium sp. SM-530-WT-3G]NME81632.1 MarR family transcriptional regulator [Clostridium sp. SM-530-WT-3G]
MCKTKEAINKLLVEIYNDILQIEEETLKKDEHSDLTITEIHTIEAIGIDKEKTMSEIAQQLNVTLGTLTTGINKLIKKGYVERNRTEEDRRIVLVRLTEKGKVAYKHHEEFHNEMVQNSVNDLTEDEKKVLASSLEKIKNFFTNKYNV